MIGFAGLGRYLNERGLALLKGRKEREANIKTDHRETKQNQTEYNKLLAWQARKRHQSRFLRITVLIFTLIALLAIIVSLFLLISTVG